MNKKACKQTQDLWHDCQDGSIQQDSNLDRSIVGSGAGWCIGRDRIVVSTSRCGRDNPGSNPGHGRAVFSVTA